MSGRSSIYLRDVPRQAREDDHGGGHDNSDDPGKYISK
jgi:hypothetical protein